MPMLNEIPATPLSLPVIDALKARRETLWFNDRLTSADAGLARSGITRQDVEEAEARLQRFAPLLAQAFPETAASGGIIESDMVPIPAMQARLAQSAPLSGALWLKKDSHLPVSGSIKARGGIYEVLAYAEKLALAAGLLNVDDDYRCLLTPAYRAFFQQHTLAVGSTGNLGLSIGIMGTRLGFNVTVHMSSDARAWKKTLLRQHGAAVIEYEHDYGVAVAQGRKAAEGDPRCHFIDDENSRTLFLGYAVAGLHLPQQLRAKDIVVDGDHPLFVYLPCGVGGGPGGVAFGLKQAFGDNVYCFFAEPTHAPCMLLGMSTGLHARIAVQDIGLDNKTVADGLAVGRASGFVGRVMEPLLAGCYTLHDSTLLGLLSLLDATEGIQLEPSALAGMSGPQRITASSSWLAQRGITPAQMQHATHLVWATGGGKVPSAEMQQYLAQGRGQTGGTQGS